MAGAATSTVRDAAEVMAPRVYMRLCLLKGKFVAADTGGGGEAGLTGGAACAAAAMAMDAAVWSRLPDDLIWRVVLLLPAAKHFQLQLVSRQWRQVLTSADFRKRFVATAAAAVGAAEEQRVIGCVIGCVRSGVSVGSGGNGGGGSKQVKVFDIDLSFVPAWFWKSNSYFVNAAADGLVYICNGYPWVVDFEPTDNQYCVINPLTRTFKMLPKVPFWPGRKWLGSSSPVAFVKSEKADDDYSWAVATCDLEGAAGQEGQWTVVDGFERGVGSKCFAVCDGEMYMFHDRRMHVRSPAAEGGSRAVVTFDGPKSLHVDDLGTSFSWFRWDKKCVKLVTHQGSVFFVAELEQLRWRALEAGAAGSAVAVCGVWRLVRSRTEWEAVAELTLEEVHRLTGFRYPECPSPSLFRAHGAGDLLCLTLGFKLRPDVGGWSQFIVGLSLEAGTWELLYDERRDGLGSTLDFTLELRPDLFLL